MIDFLKEPLISLCTAAKLLPPSRRGRPVSFQCVLRWIMDGARGPDGERVRLEAVRLGGRWLTSKEALGRFAARLTPQIGKNAAPAPRTSRQWRRAAERAERELERLGI